jgi:hypothetical protein
MTEPSNPRRPKRDTWTPQPETLALLRVSGNSINGSIRRNQSAWVERWYVNFDKYIPYFADAASCSICIAECSCAGQAAHYDGSKNR